MKGRLVDLGFMITSTPTIIGMGLFCIWQMFWKGLDLIILFLKGHYSILLPQRALYFVHLIIQPWLKNTDGNGTGLVLRIT